jgi:hypothetical protein
MTSVRSGRRAFPLAVAATLLLGACATLRAGNPDSAVRVARQSVCGAPGSVTDAACTVRGVERVGRSHRVLIDRQPPAGSDRLAVMVRGGRVEVAQRDSTAPR